MRVRRISLVLLAAMIFTALSTAHETSVLRVRPEVMGCETGCAVVASGWPTAFVIDGAVSSPINSADLAGLVVGIDDLDSIALFKTFGFWLLLCSLGALLFQRVKRGGVA